MTAQPANTGPWHSAQNVRKSQLTCISNRLSYAPTHTLAPPVRHRHKEESRVDINIYNNIPKEPNCNCLMKQISDLTDFAGKTNKEKQRKSKINSKTFIPYPCHINCILVILTCKPVPFLKRANCADLYFLNIIAGMLPHKFVEA